MNKQIRKYVFHFQVYKKNIKGQYQIHFIIQILISIIIGSINLILKDKYRKPIMILIRI